MSPSSVLMSLSYGDVMSSGKEEVQRVETRLFMREAHAGFYRTYCVAFVPRASLGALGSWSWRIFRRLGTLGSQAWRSFRRLGSLGS